MPLVGSTFKEIAGDDLSRVFELASEVVEKAKERELGRFDTAMVGYFLVYFAEVAPEAQSPAGVIAFVEAMSRRMVEYFSKPA